ncbi:transcriptional regulator GcvA [Novispirillum sp. DQ9]|uniref:transcriptional regulator GcvA n=1 Tax=Novispirillum sp. DQ9 TaxID=3398612 RepID=UPI003C798085
MVRRLPPLTALRAFEAAARLGSFSRAAEELNVTAAAISHQVKTLEEVLGVGLFVRLPRGLRLTVEGRAYLPELSRGFDALARAADGLRHEDLGGLLTISVMPSLLQLWLLPRLADFRRRFPMIDLRLRAEADQANFVRDGVDVGLRYGMGRYPGLRTLQFMQEEVFPIASPTLLSGRHPLRAWEDLRHHTLLHDFALLGNEPWLGWEAWLRAARLADIDLERGLHFDNSAILYQACIDGHGVGIGRSALLAESLRAGRLVPLFDARRPADYSYYVVAPEASADHPRVRAFMDWVMEQGAASGPAPPSTG